MRDEILRLDELTPADRKSRIDEIESLTGLYERLLANSDLSAEERKRLEAYRDFFLLGADYIKRIVKEIKFQEMLRRRYHGA